MFIARKQPLIGRDLQIVADIDLMSEILEDFFLTRFLFIFDGRLLLSVLPFFLFSLEQAFEIQKETFVVDLKPTKNKTWSILRVSLRDFN